MLSFKVAQCDNPACLASINITEEAMRELMTSGSHVGALIDCCDQHVIMFTKSGLEHGFKVELEAIE